jgi:hypothetical protein
MATKSYRLIRGKRFWRIAVGYDKRNATKRASLERSNGHNARIIESYPGEYRVWVNYDIYRK